MEKIIIRNFGPVSHFEAEVKDVMIFIGPQASGKSTISKLIFFFKSIKDDLISFIRNANPEILQKPIENFNNDLTKKFISFFGHTYNAPSLKIKYFYTRKHTYIEVLLSPIKNKISFSFSNNLSQGIDEIFEEVINYNNKISNNQESNLTLAEKLRQASELQAYITNIEEYINILFENDRTSIFIPAGRILLSTLSEQIQNIDPRSLDYLTQSFVEKIQLLKPYFKADLESQIQAIRQFNDFNESFEKDEIAVKIINNILKGNYKVTAKDERLYFNEDGYVKLNYASSGQQEALWILLLMFQFILGKDNYFTIFEEPEAHLYPESQNEIVKLMALLANINQNQIIITTHSPYILSAFNNLLYAHQIGQQKPDEVAKLVNPKLWLDVNRTSAYFIAGDRYEPIIDPELNLIQAEKIDSASRIINETFDQLFDLDD